MLQQSSLAKSPNGPCMPNHANCYCSRADFANGVKTCVKQDAALKCTADGDVNVTAAWVDGYCGDSRSGDGGNSGAPGNRNATVTVASPSSTSTSTSTTSSTTSGTAAPVSNLNTPTPSPSPTPIPSLSLSTGAKAGIAVGVIAVVAIIATLAFFLFRGRQPNKKAPPIYEVENQKRVHEADAITNPSEMDSKDSALFSQPVLVSAPVYELPSPGGGGESELDAEDTQRRSAPPNPVLNTSPLGREELVSRDGLPANDNEVNGGISGRFGGHD